MIIRTRLFEGLCRSVHGWSRLVLIIQGFVLRALFYGLSLLFKDYIQWPSLEQESIIPCA